MFYIFKQHERTGDRTKGYLGNTCYPVIGEGGEGGGISLVISYVEIFVTCHRGRGTRAHAHTCHKSYICLKEEAFVRGNTNSN